MLYLVLLNGGEDIMADIKELSDYEVIKLCLNESENYFSEIISRYKKLVYHVVLRMVNNIEESNDLVQEVFIKVYKNLDKYVPNFKLSTWIMRIATNHVIDYRRKKQLDTVYIEITQVVQLSESSPEDMLMKKEKKKYLDDLIDSLPEMYKMPILLYHKEGMSYQEISEYINIPLSKVKNRIFRGRKIMKESLLRNKEAD